MKHCPDCREDYEDFVETCATCDGVLRLGATPPLAPMPPDPLDAHGDLVVVASFSNEPEARFAEGVLRSERIATEVRRFGSDLLGPFGGAAGAVSFSLFVPVEVAPHARELVDAMRAGRSLPDVTWFPEAPVTTTYSASAPARDRASPAKPRREVASPIRVLLPLLVCASIGGFLAHVIDLADAPRGPVMHELPMSFEFTVVGVILGLLAGSAGAWLWLAKRSVKRNDYFDRE